MRVSIGTFAQTADGSFFQSLPVHITEKLPCGLNFSDFNHPLHEYTIQPEPYRAVVVGIVEMVFS